MNIAILGYGTIGKGVYKIAEGREDIVVKKILEKKEKFDEKIIDLFTNDPSEIINDESIDLVVEVLGGYDFAKGLIVKALENKKHVVTANKEIIAKDIDSLLEIAKNNNVTLLYEASVGGGIPIIKNLKEITLVSKISKITGILNGTTNFILTKMSEGLEFSDALKLAQEKGFAEADPTADLEGYDMMRKIAILADLAWNTKIEIEEIKHQGIKQITSYDIKKAKENKQVIKFVCEAELINETVKIGVSPKVFDASHFFASVNNEFNAVILETYPNDTLTFIGKGAGSLPTASAIISDIVDIINGKNIETYNEINKYIIK